jgi:hypothetical protein
MVVLSTLLFASCTKEETPNAERKVPPQVRIVGDESDVGSVVYVDGVEAGTIKPPGAHMPQTSVQLAPGKRVVEVKKNGVLRVREVFHVTSDSGVLPLPANNGSAPPNRSPSE